MKQTSVQIVAISPIGISINRPATNFWPFFAVDRNNTKWSGELLFDTSTHGLLKPVQSLSKR